MWISKRLFSRAKGRYLTFSEMITRGVGEFHYAEGYVAADIEVHDNSAEEILEATKELLQWAQGESVGSEEERRIQHTVKQMIPPAHYLIHGTAASLCASFIRRHMELMPQDSPSVLA